MANAIFVKCPGEAHSNPHIDNCLLCAPYWSEIVSCPDCTLKATANGSDDIFKLQIAKSKKSGKCEKCNKRFQIIR